MNFSTIWLMTNVEIRLANFSDLKHTCYAEVYFLISLKALYLFHNFFHYNFSLIERKEQFPFYQTI